MERPKKILVIFGTRPEAIKMCPIVKTLLRVDTIDSRVCVTAQHRQMLDSVLQTFGVTPEYDLDLMTKGQSLDSIMSAAIPAIGNILEEFKPDIVLVHGDTATSFAGALASYHQGIKVGHVEAGLRTGELYSPWPEEGYRKLVAALATYHFAPTQASKQNLLSENVPAEQIFVTGNTVIDALLGTVLTNQNKPDLLAQIKSEHPQLNFDKRLILVTGHRRENFGFGFDNICKALKQIAHSHPECEIIYPVHLNPNVLAPVKQRLNDVQNIYLIKPQDYSTFTYLLSKCFLVLTDSGGIQEEAPALRKPVLVMRQVTERIEAVEAGTVKLVGTRLKDIFQEVNRLLTDDNYYKSFSANINPYGDGKASEKIVEILRKL